MNRNLDYINEHLNIEKDGIIIISFNQNQKLLEFSLSSKKNINFSIELYDYFTVKRMKLKSKDIKQSFINSIINKSYTDYDYINSFFKMLVDLK